MFDKIFEALDNDLGEFEDFVSSLKQFMRCIEDGGMQNKTLRNEAIDEVAKFILEYKSKK